MDKIQEISKVAIQTQWRCEFEVDKVVNDYVEILGMCNDILKLPTERLEELKADLLATKPDFFLNDV